MAKDFTIEPAGGIWVIRASGAVLGESRNALKLTEEGGEPAIYFPKEDIAMAFLEPAEKRATSPRKGEASYWALHGKSGVIENAAWSYEAPKPEAEATLIVHGPEGGDAVALMAEALGSPYDVSGAAHLDGGATMVRVEGMQGMVDHRAAALLTGALAGWERVDGAESAALWRGVRDLAHLAGTPAALWRVSLKPSDAPRFSAALTAAGLQHGGVYDWGGGLAWLTLDPGLEDAGATALRAALAPFGGHATLIRAPAAIREKVDVFQPQPAPLAAISRGLKQKFDPRGLLNPGLMG